MEDKKCYVYKHFGENDVLLYVGATSNVSKRNLQHKCNSEWFSEVVRTEAKEFDSRELALAAETIAIQTGYPKYNVFHSPGFVDFNSEEIYPLKNLHWHADSLKEWVLANPDATIFDCPASLIRPTTPEMLRNGLRD